MRLNKVCVFTLSEDLANSLELLNTLIDEGEKCTEETVIIADSQTLDRVLNEELANYSKPEETGYQALRKTCLITKDDRLVPLMDLLSF